MTFKFLSSRGAQKFRRSRSAMASLSVILAFVAVASFAALGDAVAWASGDDADPNAHPWLTFLTTATTAERVGSDTQPGWGGSQNEERLAERYDFYLTRLERALEARDPEAAVAALHFAELRPDPTQSVDQLTAGLEAAWERFDELDESFGATDDLLDEHDELLEQVGEAGVGGGDGATDAELAAELTRVEAALDAARAVTLVDLAEVGAAVDGLFPMPDGGAGLRYRLRTFLGTDRSGRSISVRALYSIKTAMQVGIVTALISVLFGSLLGAAAALYGGWVDHLVIWLYSTFSSIPNLVLLSVLAFMFTGSPVDGTLVPLYTAFCLTFWIGPCRVVRGEALKIKELEYVQAATAIGFSRFRILWRHVLPNTSHLMFINFSLLFIGAIKSEVILTFLGLGLKNGASWGIMISSSKPEVLNGVFWQLGAATFFMFVLVLAFNVFTDALQDAFDPKHVS